MEWGGGNGRRRRTNACPLMVFMVALTGRFNLQIKGEITSGGGGVMEHVACKRGKAGHGGLGVAAVQAWRRRGSAWPLGLRRMKADGPQWSGREGGCWAGGSGTGIMGSVAWAGRQAKAEGVSGPAGLETKRKGNPLKMISRFRKMNKEIQVTEIIGKSQNFPKNCRKFGKARMLT
jgi:hypothetical protein